MAINLKKSKDSKKKALEEKLKKMQDEIKVIEEEEARVEAEELAEEEAEKKEKDDLEKKLEDLDVEIEELKAKGDKINEPSEGIDLNREEVFEETSMVKKDTKGAIKLLKVKEKDLKKEEKKLASQTREDEKKARRKIKEEEAEERRQSKIEKVKVMVGEKSYMFPVKAIYDLSKKDFKIKEDRRKIKEGEVCILYLRESGIADIKYVKPENGMFIVDGMYYHIVESCNYSLGPKRIPLAVIPEWSFIPISRKTHWDKLGGIPASAQKLIIKSLESAEIVKIKQENEPAKKADGKLIIMIVIAAVVGLYFLTKGSGVA